jgi:predicted RNase H-like HicB family nuclease
MKHYYAIFKKTHEAVEVEFPDLEGCVTFGKNWEKALENAEDALAGWLAHADKKFIKTPSTHDQLTYLAGDLVPIPVNESIVDSYQELKRFNVIFPRETLKAVDSFRKVVGLKRSKFLQKAAEEYLYKHTVQQNASNQG